MPALKQIRQESSASQQTRQESSTSLISEAESINRPRKKKKSWLGISGYQRLSEDGSRDISAEDSQQLIRSPSPISEVAVSGQSSKLNHGDWATDKGSISMRRNSTESSLPLKVNPAFHIPHLDVHINQLHPCVPLYTYVLPHAPEYLQGQRWCVDFQVALFLGLKSGRQLLDKYPTLSRRVLTGNEKRVLEQSTLAYAILEGIIHNGQSLKWLRLKSLDIGRGLALSSVDMHFIPLQQVLMLQELVEKRNTHVLKSKWDGLVLECTMRTDGISAVDLANVDELMGLPVREPIKESRKVQYIHKLKRK